ncbi:MAG: mechanosensitive ion channel [FCB group bacterium]|jgi:hypothetical protein|nr:mechanosensitive ion channel [FCB group bacterium]
MYIDWQDMLGNVLVALGILVIGTLIAWVISALLGRAFTKTRFDDRLAGWLKGDTGSPTVNSAKWISRIVFWILMLFVLIAVFQALDAPAVSEPLDRLLTVVMEFVPKLIGAALLLVVAWVVATLVRTLVKRGLHALNVDERINRHMSDPDSAAVSTRHVSLAQSLSDAAYWLVFLFFLPIILDVLELQGLLQPVMDMVQKILSFLPNLLMAALILLVGWFVARVVRNIVAGLLAATGINHFAGEAGLTPARMRYSISDLLAWVVYILILVPVVIMALEALQVDTITTPAIAMLNDVMVAIPRLFAAAILLLIAWTVGKLVANIIATLLDSLGFNKMLSNLGLVQTARAQAAQSASPEVRSHLVNLRHSPSDVAGFIVLVAVMLFATVEALNLLGFEGLATLVLGFLMLLGNVVLGLIIIALGAALAQIAVQAIRSSGMREADWVARIARAAILILAVAMGLQQMGIAPGIIMLAFGLFMGAIAIAAAIAFGIGGRDVAKKQVEKWADRMEEAQRSASTESNMPPPPPTFEGNPPPPPPYEG